MLKIPVLKIPMIILQKKISIASETEEKSEIKQIIVNVDETTKKELEEKSFCENTVARRKSC